MHYDLLLCLMNNILLQAKNATFLTEVMMREGRAIINNFTAIKKSCLLVYGWSTRQQWLSGRVLDL